MATRILIVEDQPSLAAAIAAILRAKGYDVGAYPSVARAMHALGAHHVDMAILDINVEDGLVFPVADELAARGVPYAFCSSMHPDDLPARHAGALFLRKPFDEAELVALAAELEGPLGSEGSRSVCQDASAPRSRC
jgi:DNA-binding response OmpR family regulator